MYSTKYYKNFTEEKIVDQIKKEGFSPYKIHNNKDYTYSPHSHPETKLLAILKGSMTVEVNKVKYLCEKYDRIIIPGTITHSAYVGPKGCIFLWAEKIINK